MAHPPAHAPHLECKDAQCAQCKTRKAGRAEVGPMPRAGDRMTDPLGNVYVHDGETGWERVGPMAPGPAMAGVAILAAQPGPRRGVATLADLTDPDRRADLAARASFIATHGWPTANLVDELGVDVCYELALDHYAGEERQRAGEARARAKAHRDMEDRRAYAALAHQARQPCGRCHNCRIGLACSYVVA